MKRFLVIITLSAAAGLCLAFIEGMFSPEFRATKAQSTQQDIVDPRLYAAFKECVTKTNDRDYCLVQIIAGTK